MLTSLHRFISDDLIWVTQAGSQHQNGIMNLSFQIHTL